MRAAIYARVSTNGNGQSPEMQLREIREYIQRRGWELTGEYVDQGVSGSKERRPELDRLMMDAKRRQFDAIVVYRYDRFARSLRHLVNALEDFRALGIEFVSIHEGVDTSTPNGRLIFGIFASIAEFERELIRDRVRSGLRNAKAKGKRLGRPKVILDAARIAALRNSGLGWKKISKQLGVGVGTVLRIAQEASKGRSSAFELGAPVLLLAVQFPPPPGPPEPPPNPIFTLAIGIALLVMLAWFVMPDHWKEWIVRVIKALFGRRDR